MTTPRAATDTRDGRFYTLDGQEFVSVTTVLGALSKPALVPWAAKLTAERAIEALSHSEAVPAELSADWHKLLEGAELPATRLERIRKWISKAPTEKREKAADVGTLVHAAVESFALGAPMSEWPGDLAEHGRHFAQFLADWQPEYLEQEATVFSKSHQYAGTLDAIARLNDGRVYLLDLKTGRHVYAEVALQLAAYAHAEHIVRPGGRVHFMPGVDAAAVLHLTGDGYQLLPVAADHRQFNVFLALLEAHRFQREWGASCLGAPLEPLRAVEVGA